MAIGCGAIAMRRSRSARYSRLQELLAWLLEYRLSPAAALQIVADLAQRWPRVLDGAWITTSEIVLGYLLAVAVSIRSRSWSPIRGPSRLTSIR